MTALRTYDVVWRERHISGSGAVLSETYTDIEPEIEHRGEVTYAGEYAEVDGDFASWEYQQGQWIPVGVARKLIDPTDPQVRERIERALENYNVLLVPDVAEAVLAALAA